MHLRSIVTSLALAGVLLASGCQAPTRAAKDASRGWNVYGSLPATYSESTPEVGTEGVARFAGTGRTIVLTGHVSEVCLTMGCWIRVEGDRTRSPVILAMTKDHAYFVPRNCVGREVHVVGRVVREVHSVEMLKHLAQDAGQSQAEIDAIVAPERRIVLIADAILLPPGGLEAPASPTPAEQEMPASVDPSVVPGAGSGT